MDLKPDQKNGTINYILPFYRFDFEEPSDSLVKVSIKEAISGSAYIGELCKPNKNETGPDTFIQQDTFDQYLVNDCLTLSIEVEIITKYSASNFGSKLNDHTGKVLKDLNAIKDSTDISDFTYNVGDTPFHVHKMMLAGN